jgi:phosphoglycolate phosphatase
VTKVIVRPRVILFDWDNTLVDSWRCIWLAMNATLSAMGHPKWSLAETKARVARSMRDSFPALFGDRWEEAGDLFYREFKKIHLDHLRPLPGIPEMLNELTSLGMTMGVVSNKKGSILREEAEHLGWQGMFRSLVGAGDAVSDKPTAAPALLALEPIHVPAGDDVWFVGDSLVDIQCALNASCTPVLLRETPPDMAEFGEFWPYRHFFCCTALLKLVRTLVIPIS